MQNSRTNSTQEELDSLLREGLVGLGDINMLIKENYIQHVFVEIVKKLQELDSRFWNRDFITHLLQWMVHSNQNHIVNEEHSSDHCLTLFTQFMIAENSIWYQSYKNQLLQLLIEKNRLSMQALDFVLNHGKYANVILKAYNQIKDNADVALQSALLYCDRRSVLLAQAMVNNNSTKEDHYKTLSDLIGDNNPQSRSFFKIESKSSLEHAFKSLLDTFNRDQKSFNDQLDEQLKSLSSFELQIVLNYMKTVGDDNNPQFMPIKHLAIKKIKSNLKTLRDFEALYKKNSFFGDWFLFLRSTMANLVYSGCVTKAAIEHRKRQGGYDGSTTQQSNTEDTRRSRIHAVAPKRSNDFSRIVSFFKPEPPRRPITWAPKQNFRDRS